MKRLDILIVEDEKPYARMMQEMMKHHRCRVAGSADEGLQMFAQKKADIVFLDIGLPDHSGLNLLGAIKCKNPDTFVVMLTASRIRQDVEDARRAGASAYVVKPFNSRRVMQSIEMYEEYCTRLEVLSPEERRMVHMEYFEKARELHDEMRQEKKAMRQVEAVLPVGGGSLRRRVLSSWRVLVGAKDETQGRALTSVMKEIGCAADLVFDATRVMAQLQLQPYHLLVLDDGLPGIENDVLVRRLREGGNVMPLVLMSDDRRQKENLKWRLLGVRHFLPRNPSLGAFLQVLEHQLVEAIDELGQQYI